jgi:hypothetical protein
MHFLHVGRNAKFAIRPAGKFCLKARLRAKSARQKNAKFARQRSAEFARDSY